MNVSPHRRSGIALILLTGCSVVLGICSLYQRVSSQPVFPIDKETLTITAVGSHNSKV